MSQLHIVSCQLTLCIIRTCTDCFDFYTRLLVYSFIYFIINAFFIRNPANYTTTFLTKCHLKYICNEVNNLTVNQYQIL